MGFINKLFGKYLVATNISSCGLMMALGDSIQQRIEFYQKHKNEIRKNFNLELDLRPYKLEKLGNNKEPTPKFLSTDAISWSDFQNYKHDFTRTANMGVAGFAQGPFLHYFYTFLDKVLQGKSFKTLSKKMVFDQSFASPSLILIFFVVVGFMERKKVEEIWNEIRMKFLDTYKMDLCFWPPIQMFNFLILPAKYRVIYLNVMVIIYNVLLSHIYHDDSCNDLNSGTDLLPVEL